MPTQEERLTAVENDLKQFKAETVRAYQDSAVDLALVKGLAMGAYERLNAVRSQIADFKQDMLDRFGRQDSHFEAQDAHLNMHDKRFDTIEQKIDGLNNRFESLEQTMNNRFQTQSERFDRFEKLLLDRLPPS